ncbi:MAG: PEP-CTERM sorting domain-containing protein [Verrucomicrobia bacterium]|jgi:hypothetical protein|nr:PEP-CTERM sorting domain-containing protein [Verrucomicrobiota bacterium]
MKTKILLFTLGILLVPALGLAQTPVLVQTQSYSWSLAQNLQLISTEANGGVFAYTSINGVSVSKYTGALDLTRVVIKILQPATPVSPTINVSLAVATGESTVFSNDTGVNSVSESTTLLGNKVSVYNNLKTLTGNNNVISNYYASATSGDYANTPLTSPDTISRSLDLTNSAVTLFDSSSYSLSSANLNTLFRDGSNITFGGANAVNTTFGYDRSNASLLTATITGTNSGKVSIEYYAVPEPETWALLAFSLTTVMVLRRRRNH